MPKLKSHRGAAKRFKKTASGKFKRSSAFKRHILSTKTTKRKRALRGMTLVSEADQKALGADAALQITTSGTRASVAPGVVRSCLE